MNAGWHERHPMPKKATAVERFAWHMAHQNACACRPIPPGVIAALNETPKKPNKRKR